MTAILPNHFLNGGQMTSKTYKCGPFACKAYKKPAGKGYEVGITMAGHPIFVGNFIHAKEANAWWTKMNLEVGRFGKKYHLGPKTPLNWFSKFMSNYMYKTYYAHLDTQFTKYNRGFAQAVRKDERKFNHFKKSYARNAHHMSARRAA
jgi:hypothetical protein